MKFSVAKVKLPTVKNSLLAFLSAVLLTLSFPNFDLWFIAWFALIPLFYAIDREKESAIKSFVLGWIFGICFFFGTCWWLTFSLINYGGIPTVIAYSLLFIATLLVGIFAAIFAAVFSILLKRFGVYAVFAAPFVWTATEFLRLNLTGNSWNAIGYSQFENPLLLGWASYGGVPLVGFLCVFINACYTISLLKWNKNSAWFAIAPQLLLLICVFIDISPAENKNEEAATVVAVQPNVPMSGLNDEKWEKLRGRQIELAESALNKERTTNGDNKNTLIILPESPMNYMYDSDPEFQDFITNFAVRNNASVLFNSAQTNAKNDNFLNSAVMLDSQGNKVGQYDKIHLVPFGEYVPLPEPVAVFIPTVVGNFQYGEKYNLLPFGDLKAGIMICFESHFASLSREFVKNGADVLIEMTNDGYLGDTAVLRQHLASAVFRAVETNRPVVRVTNVGITAYINERGEVLDAAKQYVEDTRVWTVAKSDGSQTFYVKYGDWFAWLCSIVSLALLILNLRSCLKARK